MLSKKMCKVMCVIALIGLLASTAGAVQISHGGTTVNMDFVTVGNPGNAGDTSGYPKPCGAVAYTYSIGKYEVTADQWAQVIAIDPNVGNWGYWSGSQPTAGTSWHEAARFCNWLTTGDANTGYYTIVGGLPAPNALGHDAYAALYGTTYFIPTEDEWYKAAYYNGSAGIYYDYPTGSNSMPDGIDFAGDTTFDAVFNDGYNQGHPNAVTNAGVASPYGTIGQGGNVWEWNETAIYTSHPLWRGFRGGSWLGAYHELLVTGGIADEPTFEFSYLGFRVASIPEPGSIVLLLTGALLGLLAYAWRRWK